MFMGFVLLAALLWPVAGRSGEVKPLVLTAEERAWLAAHPDLTFCFSDAFKSFLFLDKDQKPAGYWPDLYQLLS